VVGSAKATAKLVLSDLGLPQPEARASAWPSNAGPALAAE
jgi:hypothetical protein